MIIIIIFLKILQWISLIYFIESVIFYLIKEIQREKEIKWFKKKIKILRNKIKQKKDPDEIIFDQIYKNIDKVGKLKINLHWQNEFESFNNLSYNIDKLCYSVGIYIGVYSCNRKRDPNRKIRSHQSFHIINQFYFELDKLLSQWENCLYELQYFTKIKNQFSQIKNSYQYNPNLISYDEWQLYLLINK